MGAFSLAVKPLHLLVLVGVMLLWGMNFAVTKIGLQEIPPLLLMTLRFALASLLLVPFVPRPRGRWLEIALLSFTLGLVHFSLMFTGLTRIDAGTAAIAIQLQVPFASLLAAFFLGDRPGWRRLLGMAIAFVGVAIIAGGPRLNGEYLSLGMIVCAAMIWAVANIQIKRLDTVSGLTLNAWVAFLATPQLILATLILEDGQWQAIQEAAWPAWFAVVYQAVLVYGVGYGLWYWMLKQYSVTQTIPFTLLVPFFGVLSGILFLDEPLTLALVLGGCCTLAGVGIIVLRRPRTTAPEAERM